MAQKFVIAVILALYLCSSVSHAWYPPECFMPFIPAIAKPECYPEPDYYDYQNPTPEYPPPTGSYQHPTPEYPPPTVSHQNPTSEYPPPTVSHQNPTPEYSPPTESHQNPTSGHSPPTRSHPNPKTSMPPPPPPLPSESDSPQHPVRPKNCKVRSVLYDSCNPNVPKVYSKKASQMEIDFEPSDMTTAYLRDNSGCCVAFALFSNDCRAEINNMPFAKKNIYNDVLARMCQGP